MRLRGWSAALVAVTAILVAGCVSQTARPPAAPVDAAQARAYDLRRGELRNWNLSGRIAVSNGSRGGSGRIDWQQGDGGYTVSLSAPVTRQSWQLSGNALGARLDGIEGGPRESADVEALLLSTTGWNIPVRALPDWMRGLGATASEYGPAKLIHSPAGLPSRLEQGGWVIEYQEWHPADAALPPLPRRIVAKNGPASVRLIIDEWRPQP